MFAKLNQESGIITISETPDGDPVATFKAGDKYAGSVLRFFAGAIDANEGRESAMAVYGAAQMADTWSQGVGIEA